MLLTELSLGSQLVVSISGKISFTISASFKVNFNKSLSVKSIIGMNLLLWLDNPSFLQLLPERQYYFTQ
jgi:hypothetical protein